MFYREVMVGTRTPEETTSRAEPDAYGPPFGAWQEEHPEVKLATFSKAAAHGEMVVNATSGVVSLDALELAGEDNSNGEVLVGISNPLDFSEGMTPILSVSNPDSLGEQIQPRFPEARVVKTLHTMNAYLMVNPAQLAGADHTVFMCGDRAAPELRLDGHRRPGRYHCRARHADAYADLAAEEAIRLIHPSGDSHLSSGPSPQGHL